MQVQISRLFERFNPLDRGEWVYELEGAARRFRDFFALE